MVCSELLFDLEGKVAGVWITWLAPSLHPPPCPFWEFSISWNIHSSKLNGVPGLLFPQVCADSTSAESRPSEPFEWGQQVRKHTNMYCGYSLNVYWCSQKSCMIQRYVTFLSRETQSEDSARGICFRSSTPDSPGSFDAHFYRAQSICWAPLTFSHLLKLECSYLVICQRQTSKIRVEMEFMFWLNLLPSGSCSKWPSFFQSFKCCQLSPGDKFPHDVCFALLSPSVFLTRLPNVCRHGA